MLVLEYDNLKGWEDGNFNFLCPIEKEKLNRMLVLGYNKPFDALQKFFSALQVILSGEGLDFIDLFPQDENLPVKISMIFEHNDKVFEYKFEYLHCVQFESYGVIDEEPMVIRRINDLEFGKDFEDKFVVDFDLSICQYCYVPKIINKKDCYGYHKTDEALAFLDDLDLDVNNWESYSDLIELFNLVTLTDCIPVIDCLDKYHVNVGIAIIEWLGDRRSIILTQNPLLTRDFSSTEIWFADMRRNIEDSEWCNSVYALSDFRGYKEEFNGAFVKKYLLGRFGGIPIV